jgi:hypothetical protein
MTAPDEPELSGEPYLIEASFGCDIVQAGVEKEADVLILAGE